MARSYLQNGERLTAPAPAGGAIAGNGYLFGTLFGVCGTSAPAGTETVFLLHGVHALVKAPGAVTLGQLLYWDDAGKLVTTASAGNTLIGKAFAAAAAGDATVAIRLSQA